MGRVVAVAGVAGAGKSTLARGLVDALGDAVGVHIDRYQRITNRPVREIVRWMRDGASFDEFEIPLLADHLQRLKQGVGVVDPVTMEAIPARKYVVFETHFGRAHEPTGKHIDFLVWVDTPLEVALARNVRDLIRPLIRQPAPERERLMRLSEYVESYLADVRSLVLLQRERVAAEADLRVDGTGEPDDIIAAVRRAVVGRFG